MCRAETSGRAATPFLTRGLDFRHVAQGRLLLPPDRGRRQPTPDWTGPGLASLFAVECQFDPLDYPAEAEARVRWSRDAEEAPQHVDMAHVA